MAQKLNRNINMGFRVNEDEKFFIDKKMETAGFTNFRQFMLHHIVRDEIVKLDLTGVTEMNALLRNISNNVNPKFPKIYLPWNLKPARLLGF